MTYMNLIYLGYITDRIPVLADFTPNGHIGTDSPTMPFSEVFDIPRFISQSGIPILEWAEVKERESEVVDDIGCWNVWESVQYNERGPRNSDGPRRVGLGELIGHSVIRPISNLSMSSKSRYLIH